MTTPLLRPDVRLHDDLGLPITRLNDAIRLGTIDLNNLHEPTAVGTLPTMRSMEVLDVA